MTSANVIVPPFIWLGLLLVLLGVLVGGLTRVLTPRTRTRTVSGYVALGLVPLFIYLGATPTVVPHEIGQILAAPVSPVLLGYGLAVVAPNVRRAPRQVPG